MTKPVKRIPGFENYLITKDSKIYSLTLGKMLTPWIETGYLRIALRDKYRRKYQFFVHRLVAGTFIGVRPDGHVVNHRDHNKLNNHCDNLEYITQQQNINEAMKQPQWTRGENNGMCKLTDIQVKEIKEKYKQVKYGKKLAEQLAIEYKVSISTIYSIALGYRR